LARDNAAAIGRRSSDQWSANPVHHKQAVDLQSRINDLIGIQALPAIWSGQQSYDIVGILLEAVVRILDLDFAYAHVRDSPIDSSIELMRLPQCRAPPISAEQFRRDLRNCLGGDLPTVPVAIPNPLGQGVVKIAPFHFGVHDELGVALAVSQRSDFPTKNEMLLLRVAGSAAAIGMQEARMLNAHRRAADELERRVAERTAQLTAANEELSREIVERKRAEDAALVLKDALAFELSTMTRLHELTTRLAGNTELQQILEEVLDAAIGLHNADFGLVQLCNTETGGLEVVAQRGFDKEFLNYFCDVRDDTSACGRALQRQACVVIEDVETDPGFAPHRAIAAAAGFRAVQSTPFRDRSGRPLGVISTHFRRPHRPTEHDLRLTDLFARQAAATIESKLAEDERRKLASLVEASPDFIGIASLEGEVQFVNPQGRKLLGLEGDFAANIFELVIEADREKLAKQALPAVTRDGHWDGEIRFRNFKTGHPIPMQQRIFFISDVATGRRIALATVSRDVSESKRTEQARQESELRWRAVYENSAVGIWLTDAAGRFVAANRALQDMLGYTEVELQKLSLNEITPEEDWYGAQARIDQLRERSILEYHAQQRYYRKDGCIIWGNTSAALIPSVDNGPNLLVEIIEDISARKQTEGALAQAQADLARVTRVTLMGELAASIAHEVNQPLAAVVANGSACRRWLAAAPPNTAEASDAADRIIRDAARASDVISRIRGFLRRGELHKVPLDLDEVIHEVIGFVQDKVSTQLVELHVEIMAGTPRVFADRIQLQQVILNLMLNAIEAMEKVAQPRVLRLAVGSHGENTVRVAVSDTGPGIAATQRQRIFDAFFSTKADGIGMGLAISRSIIESNQGRLWATKNAGRGETFQFVLPTAAPGHP
jgi:PAS domain S-box-containing protein